MKFKRRKNRNELLKHPVVINVLLSRKIRGYSIPFLGTFSRGTDPFWLAPHVRLNNMSRIYRMLFIVFVPCFPMLLLYLYFHLFLCFVMYPLFFKVLPYFLVRPFFPLFSCFHMYPRMFLCFPMYSYVFPCMFSHISPCFPMFCLVFPIFYVFLFSPRFPFFSLVFLWFPMFPPVFLYTPLFSYVLPCFLTRSLVFLCFPVHPPLFLFSNVFPCFLMFSLAFLYFSLHPPFFLCFQMFSPVFLFYSLVFLCTCFADYHTGCRNVNHYQHQQSSVSPGRSYSTYLCSSCYHALA